MRLVTADERNRMVAACQREALHLEMRDSYHISDEAARLAAFRATGQRDTSHNSAERTQWLAMVRGLTSAGKRLRRARIVSEPVSDYIRYEWAGTHENIAAGEEVRWLPRRHASAIALPGNDFWLFDAQTVVFTVFAASGEVVVRQLTDDPAVVGMCERAFESVWAAAIPHESYRPR